VAARQEPHDAFDEVVDVADRAGLAAVAGHRERLAGQRLLPALVVEVLSPGSATVDLTLKRRLYEEAGIPAYWLVEPEHPALTVLQLVAGRFEEVAAVAGGEVWAATMPFSVQIEPAALVR
jgi:Uma2 family endonuclease